MGVLYAGFHLSAEVLMQQAFNGADSPQALVARADRAVALFPFDPYLHRARNYMRRAAAAAEAAHRQP